MENNSLELTSVFALCIKKFLIILLCALIGMGFACGLRYAKYRKSASTTALVTYNEKLSELNNEYDSLKAELSAKRSLKSEIDHNISVLNVSSANSETASILASYASLSSSLIQEFESLEKQIPAKADEIKAFKASAPTASAFSAKAAVVGFLAGGFISVTVLLSIMIGANYVTSSADYERRLKAPLIGALYTDNGLFDTAARKVISERNWKNSEEAVNWLKMNLNSSVLPDKAKVCLLYSSNNSKAVSALKEASSVLSGCGYKVTSISAAFKNPETSSAVEKCDVVVLFEKQFKSKWSCVNAVVNTARRYEKKICALILC